MADVMVKALARTSQNWILLNKKLVGTYIVLQIWFTFICRYMEREYKGIDCSMAYDVFGSIYDALKNMLGSEIGKGHCFM